MGFSRQEYWSGLPFPSPGDLPDPGIKPKSPAFQADALISEPPGKPHAIWGNKKTYKLEKKKQNIYSDIQSIYFKLKFTHNTFS